MFLDTARRRYQDRLVYERINLLRGLELPEDVVGTSLDVDLINNQFVFIIFHEGGYQHELKSFNLEELKELLSSYCDPWLQYKED